MSQKLLFNSYRTENFENLKSTFNSKIIKWSTQYITKILKEVAADEIFWEILDSFRNEEILDTSNEAKAKLSQLLVEAKNEADCNELLITIADTSIEEE